MKFDELVKNKKLIPVGNNQYIDIMLSLKRMEMAEDAKDILIEIELLKNRICVPLQDVLEDE